MAALTKFGKEVRKLRIERGETMMDMAKKVGRPPSLLSAVETGQKGVPEGLVEQIIASYGLDDAASEVLRSAAFESATVYKIKPAGEQQRELVAAFARKLDALSAEERSSMLRILKH